MNVLATIADLASLPATTLSEPARRAQALDAIGRFLKALESGELRSAERNASGEWQANSAVKQAILFCFRVGKMVTFGEDEALTFVDKDTLPARKWRADEGVRVVPGGTSVRRGAFVAPQVTLMPPAYINVGAFVDEGTMVDSHALVGSCAQIGKRVHLSAGVQIGGVLEPIGATPVIVEDDAFVGGNCGLYEGTLVRERAVIGAGVILTKSTTVYDLVHERVIKSDATGLEIPAGAVVVPGSRPARGEFAEGLGLNLGCAVIVKYRDDKTDAKALLESALR